MKEVFMALAIVAIFLTWSNVAEAKAFTHEQLDKIIDYIGQNPAVSPENTATINLDAAQLKERFNAEIEPVLTKAQFDSDETREVMEKLFYIKDYQVFNSASGDLYMNVFGDSVIILGVTGTDNTRFKLLSCAYTMPETKNDNTLSSLVLVSFTKALLPEADAEQFLREVTEAQANGLTRDGIKFTVGKDDNFVLFTAVAE